jgi:hypothetical protein
VGVEGMEFVKDMYLSNNIKNSKDIIKKLEKNQSISDLYCICIDAKSNTIVEIIHSHEIHKPIYQNRNYIVIGISNTKNEAKKMICDIILEMYEKDNQLLDLKNMLLQYFCKDGEQ